MQNPAALEQWILALALAGSLAAAWRGFRRVLQTILASRPDAGYRLRPLGARLARFAREVLLQSKVIRERPAAGLAHAVVFWGFCAFALVTVNHLSAGFGVELISRESGIGRAYFGAVAGFAAAVAVAITGLAVRRFWIRPPWLGELSLESGLIALLIFVLMATYLADYFSIAPGRALWWTHTAALLLFLPLIPRTKHLHLVLSPVTVFFEREGFGQIPPLAGDDDFGLDTGRDVTRLTALGAYTCVECGRCTEHCPAYNTGKELNPKQIVLGLRAYLNAHGPRAGAPLLGVHLSQEAVFQCTTCGACEYQCPVGIQHLPLIVGLRRGAVNTGQWEDDHGTRLFLNLERNGNPLGLPASERERFIREAGLPRYSGSEEVCLWLGCMGAYDPQGRQIAVALARLLRHLGVSFGVLEREKCTGDAARRLGNDLVFEELARFNLEQLRKAGVKKLLSICPHCVRTISSDWRQVGEAPPIEHHSEMLARYAERLPAAGGGRTITFHDPCYLGRYRGIYEAPRKLAGRSGPLVEPRRTRARSFCCGAGGGLAFLGEEKGRRVSAERAAELAATGAQVIAAACPFCHTMFRDALASVTGAPDLLDIAQIAAAGLPQT
jgi:Fe-S oxidoreductase